MENHCQLLSHSHFIYLFYYKNDAKLFFEGFNNPQDESHNGETQDDLYILVLDDTMWEIPRENISVVKRLGSGNFGYVDKALAIGLPGLPGQVTVAVKTLKGIVMSLLYIKT
jgi:hypothetical protein